MKNKETSIPNKLPLTLKCIVIYFIYIIVIATSKFVLRFPDYRSLSDIVVYGLMAFGILKRLAVAQKWIPIFITLDIIGFIFGLSTGKYTLNLSRYIRWGGDLLIHCLILIYFLWSPRVKAVLSENLGMKTAR